MTTRKRVLWPAVALAVIGAFGVRPAAADTPALNFSNFSTVQQGNFVVGWEFDVLSPVTVTGLGMFEYSGLSLNGHAVGIYDPSQALVATATVGPSDPLSGYFRFRSLVTPVTLMPGTGYRIAGVALSEYYAYGISTPPTGWTVDSRISYIGDRYEPGSTLTYPMLEYPSVAYGLFGPNMMLRDPDVVPEPALLQLPALLGLSGIAWWRRRRA